MKKSINKIAKKKPKSEGAITHRRRVFVHYYLKTLNATEAARLAGYSGSTDTLGSSASRLLRSSEVRAAIADHFEKVGMTTGEVIARLTAIARGDLADFVDFQANGEWKFNLQKAKELGKLGLIKEFQTTGDGSKIKLHDPIKALELIGRALGLFIDRQEHTGAYGQPLTLRVEFDQ